MSKKLKLAILISGRGSNMRALIEACKKTDYPAEVVLVISNKADAKGLDFAKESGIKNITIDHKKFASREEFDQAMNKEIAASGADLVCLAGFMRLLSPWFTNKWQGRAINIHPSILPAFKGIKAYGQALQAGAKITGCTVHFLTPGMDEGPAIVQAAAPIFEGETEEDLSERIIKVEHKCYVLAVKLIADGKVQLKGGKVSVKGQSRTDEFIISPQV